MPNWFNFTLEVSGKEKDVQEFVENVKGSKEFETEDREFDFNHFIPQPENLFRDKLSHDKEMELKSKGIPDWYNWNIDNWGTKWNAVVDDSYWISELKNLSSFRYDMATAWADPRPIIMKMIEKYPNLEFEISGEEESNEYGIYISTYEDVFLEEKPCFVDENNGLEVYYSTNDHCWRYMESNEAVEDSENFFPRNKYSWN